MIILNDIKRVSIIQLSGSKTEFEVSAVITNSVGEPLWLERVDIKGLTVIYPWVSILEMKVLELNYNDRSES